MHRRSSDWFALLAPARTPQEWARIIRDAAQRPTIDPPAILGG